MALMLGLPAGAYLRLCHADGREIRLTPADLPPDRSPRALIASGRTIGWAWLGARSRAGRPIVAVAVDRDWAVVQSDRPAIGLFKLALLKHAEGAA